MNIMKKVYIGSFASLMIQQYQERFNLPLFLVDFLRTSVAPIVPLDFWCLQDEHESHTNDY